MTLRTILLTGTLTLGLLAGCGDDKGTGGTGGTGGSTATGGTGGTGTPPAPTLGAQIDRMGRPAINTALNHTFDLDATAKDDAKNAWNANDDPSKWSAYVEEIEKNLAILDGIDTVCGNQLLADMAKTDATRYATLATVLADDRLYVNTTGPTCDIYLGVEANAVGIGNDDCGGRTLQYDVIETSYSALAAGMLDGIDDTIGISDAAKGETFPYLVAPH